MKVLLNPAIIIMHHLTLLPKFVIQAILFISPALLVSGLLIHELNQSISFSQIERNGVQQIRMGNDLLQQIQQHRALQHLSRNSKLQEAVQGKRKEIDAKLVAFQQLLGNQSAATQAASLAAIREIVQSWAGLQQKIPASKPKQIYAAHNALIEQIYRLINSIANHANLSLDPEVDSYYLSHLFTRALPELTEGISDLAGRGAAYIDTGLLEPNEDLLMNGDVMLASRDIARIQTQIDAMFRENPAFKPLLEAQLKQLSVNAAFLARAKNEVLNSFQQSSGAEFYAAGDRAHAGLYKFANACATLLDSTLQMRIERKIGHRNAILAVVIISALIAGYLLTGFYVSFSGEVAQLTDAVTLIAEGDLSSPMGSHGNDEIGQLINAFDAMRIDLAHIVFDIRHGTEAMTAAAHEIAHANLDLSNRTEAQAESLQETSNSMTELTEAVKHNDASVEQVSHKALLATEVASAGRNAMAQMTVTMNAILLSSKQIQAHTGVIDSIAFQTNLLALNAAVEAARAGEQGRGFAIVANEVRSLAQISANAAKEIRGLITTASMRANAGSQQVQSAGQAMQQIVDSIQTVTHTMHNITEASAEQRTSIEGMDHALRQIDGITQENVALVEEAEAAAKIVHDLALALSAAVARFTIADSQGVAAAPKTSTHKPVSRLLHANAQWS